jgi:MFS family permease
LLMEGIRSPVAIVAAMMVNGYAAGTKTQITGFLTASYGGMKSFGVVYGVMAALMAAAAGLGPLLAGVVYDHSGSYGPFLLVGVIGCALGGVMIVSLPAYPKWEQRDRG